MEGFSRYGFSEGGEFFCSYCDDGKLKVWDTESGILKQEYTPNLSLSSPCTSLVWVKLSRGPVTTKKKRASTEGGGELNAIALGTLSGQIILFCVSSNEVSHLEGGPPSSVNSLSWVRGSNLFSCAGSNIIEWALSEKTIESEWKVGKHEVTSLLVLPEGKGLLSATHSITLWSLPEHKRLKSFVGHATDVCSMVFIPSSLSSSSSYFISAANADRFLSAWCLDMESSNEHVVQFAMEDSPVGLSICSSGITSIAVVARSGIIHLYNLQLNGKLRKPVKPVLTIHIASSSTPNKSKEKGISIPIVGGHLCNPTSVLMAYGRIPFLGFEKITLDCSESVLQLVRQNPKKASRSKTPTSNVVEPELGPGIQYVNKLTDINMPPEIHTSARKLNRKIATEVPMETRLNNLSLNRPETSNVPRADNAAQLLLQALKSKDKKMIETVLQEKNELLIKRTVSRLPVQVVLQLIQELATRMQGNVCQCRIAAVWLRVVMSVHASQILANPDAADCLAPIFGLIDTKLAMLDPLLRLKGRLDLLLEQLSQPQTGKAETEEKELLVYEDSYSSEEESLGEEIVGNTDIDENWDEFSEVDEVEESGKDDCDQDEMSIE